MFLRKFSLPFALESSSLLISTRFSFWSSVNKCGTNFALTRCIWSVSEKIWWQDPMLMPTSSATFWIVKWWFQWTLSAWLSFVDVEGHPGIFTNWHSALFKMLKPFIALRSAHTVFPVCFIKQLKYLCKIFTKFAAKFHTHTHTHTMLFFKLFDTLSLIWRTACAHTQFSRCSSITNAHSEKGQMAVWCQNLTLGALSSRNMLSVLVGALLKSSVSFWTRLVYLWTYYQFLKLFHLCF